MKYMYHATDYNNVISILTNGLKPGYDGIVYMTEKESDAVKFVALRNYEKIVTIRIKILKVDEKDIFETFDHSIKMFGCKAYGCNKTISADRLKPSRVYNNPFYVKQQ